MMPHGWKKIIMKNKAYDLSSYTFSSDEQILVDTNVWLYLFPAPCDIQHKFVQQYSSAFAKLVSAKALPVLDPMVLSEYLNRYIRIEWRGNYKSLYPEYKDFRNSRCFQAAALDAEAFAKKILSFCQVHSISASELNLVQALREFSVGDIDFNDAILIDICKKENLRLMTNDGDFQHGGIEILTINQRLLRACP